MSLVEGYYQMIKKSKWREPINTNMIELIQKRMKLRCSHEIIYKITYGSIITKQFYIIGR